MTSREGWIKCSERMPNSGPLCLVRNVYDDTDIASFDFEENNWFGVNDYYRAYEITHWQPLPEPPQESNDDKS